MPAPLCPWATNRLGRARERSTLSSNRDRRRWSRMAPGDRAGVLLEHAQHASTEPNGSGDASGVRVSHLRLASTEPEPDGSGDSPPKSTSDLQEFLDLSRALGGRGRRSLESTRLAIDPWCHFAGQIYRRALSGHSHVTGALAHHRCGPVAPAVRATPRYSTQSIARPRGGPRSNIAMLSTAVSISSRRAVRSNTFSAFVRSQTKTEYWSGSPNRFATSWTRRRRLGFRMS